jgi:hypothetical protein
MLTLSEMQSKSVAELETLARAPGNKYYSCALTHMAHAQTEYALAGKRTAQVDVHVKAACTAYAKAQSEALSIESVRNTAKVVSERGASLSASVPGGKNVVKVGMSKLAIWDLSWGTR